MAHVVIIGASTGGFPAAYDLRATLGKNHLITVISNSDTFQFVPSNPWVAVGWRSRQDTIFELAPYLAKKHIAFIPVAAQEIKPDTNQVILADGRVLDYDYLVIATGPKLAFDEVEGLGPQGHTHHGVYYRPCRKDVSRLAGIPRGPRPYPRYRWHPVSGRPMSSLLLWMRICANESYAIRFPSPM